MPCASFKIMADSLKQNSLLRYLRTSDNEKEVQRKRKELSNAFSEKETEELSASKKTRAEAELSKPKQNARSMRTFQTQWKKGRQCSEITQPYLWEIAFYLPLELKVIKPCHVLVTDRLFLMYITSF